MMKRFTLFCLMAGFLGMFAVQSANAQGTRNKVAVEIFGGTWCTFCPGSALGGDDLVLNGQEVAIIDHHVGDVYETTETDARDGYYAVSGYPTTFFDGTISHVGGNASSSIYSTYLPLYNQAYAVATPFNLSMTWNRSGNTVTADVTINQAGMYTAGNLALHFMATESHIPDNWLAGLSEVNFVTRDMVPNENGTPITISMGQSVTQTLTLTLDATWATADMEIVAFLQNTSSKEVFNTAVESLFQPTGQVDPAVINLMGIPSVTCATSFTPDVSVRNWGSDPITNLEFTYSVNGGMATVYNWTGNIASGDREDITLNTINFTPNPLNNMFDLNITDVNSGATDVDLLNNTSSAMFDSERGDGTYTVEIQLDDYGSETTWDLRDGSNQVILSGGPYTDGNAALIMETANLSNDCFTFTINDAFGDGICCAWGQGYYRILDPSNNIVTQGGQFGSVDTRDWGVAAVVSVDDRLTEGVTLFPNPNNGLFTLDLGVDFSAETAVSIHTLQGKQVFSTIINGQSLDINVQDLASGMYMVKVHGDDGVTIKRFNKQ
ncbi:MAG: T9SS type A sorting domain-containing protein [Bacteroidota bacterium]